MYEIECGGALADQIRIQKQGAENGPLSLCEVVVYGDSTQGNEKLHKMSSALLSNFIPLDTSSALFEIVRPTGLQRINPRIYA